MVTNPISLDQAIAILPNMEPGNGVAVISGTNTKVRTKVIYYAGLGTELAARANEVIDQTTQKSVGITNSDGQNKLNAGRSYMVTAIRVLFDTTASVTVKTALWKSEAPAAFKNGEIVVYQSGSGNLFESGIGPLAKYASSLSVEQEFVPITPFLIRPDTEYGIRLNLAGATAADQAYKIEFYGYEFTDGSRA
jgi:hypothetical protein